MGVGVGIFLIAVGLILALGVSDRIENVDLVQVGWILTGVGVLGLVIALVMNAQRSHTSHRHEEHVVEDRPRRPDSTL